MSNMILKPKHLMTFVPGYGVVNKADFTEEHLAACTKQVKDTGGNVDEYLKSRFEAASYEDMPLFVDNGEPKPKSKGKKKPSDEEELERMIAEEEKAKQQAPE